MNPEIFVTIETHPSHALIDVSQHVAAGGRHALVSSESGAVFGFGQITANNAALQTLPTATAIDHLANIVAVGVGRDQDLAVEAGTLVSAWGCNLGGQLGADPALEPTRALPDRISNLAKVIKVDGGAEHSLALTSDQQVFAWGSNDTGQLGTATPTSGVRHAPVSVGLSGVRDIATGYYHNLAIDGAGAVWSWGKGKYGQLGDNQLHADFNPTPRQVAFPVATHVIDVAASNYFSLAVDLHGQVWGWGRDARVLGDANAILAPRMLAGLTGIKAVAAGQSHALALREDGKVLAWGYNPEGLGDGANKASATPVEVSGLADVIAIASGAQFMLAVTGDGKLWAWGVGKHGQLGRDTASSPVPLEVSGVRLAVPEPHPRLGEQQLGVLTVAQQGAPRTFTIENYGTAPLTLASVTLEGADAGEFVLTPPQAQVLQPGERTTVSVSFAPKSAGDKHANLKIVSDDIGDEDYLIPLAATGNELPPTLGLSTKDPADAAGLAGSKFDFGAIEGQARAVTFEITNVGGGTLELTGDPVIAIDSPYFALTAGATKTKLGSGESTEFTVTFDPSRNDAVTTLVKIETSVGPQGLELSGSRVGPVLEVSRGGEILAGGATVDLGKQGLDSKGPKLTLTIRNAGDRPLTTGALTLAGADVQDFKLEGVVPPVLAPGESVEITVQFTPRAGSAIGSKQATLTLDSDDPERPTISFTLTGEASSAVTTSPANRLAAWEFTGDFCDAQGHLRRWSGMPMINTKGTSVDSGIGGVVGVARDDKTVWVLKDDGKVYPVATTLKGAFILGAAIPGLDRVVQIGCMIRPIKHNPKAKITGPTEPLTWLYAGSLYCLRDDGTMWAWTGKALIAEVYQDSRRGKAIAGFSCGMENMLTLFTDGTIVRYTDMPATLEKKPFTDVIAVAASARRYSKVIGPVYSRGIHSVWATATGCLGALLQRDGSVWIWPDANTPPMPAKLPAGRKIVSLVGCTYNPYGVDDQGDSWELRHDAPPHNLGIKRVVAAYNSFKSMSDQTWILNADGAVFHAGSYADAPWPGSASKRHTSLTRVY